MKEIQTVYPGQGLLCLTDVVLLNQPSGLCLLNDETENLYLFARDGSKPGADELGPAAVGAEGLLCPVPHETHEVQEGQLAQLPGLQA